MKILRYFLTCSAVLMSTTAWAQWQWISQDGHQVFSDRAPPPEVAEKNILKRPSALTARNALPAALAASAADIAAAASAPQNAANPPKLKGIDKDLIAKKQQADQAEEEKRKAGQAKTLKIKIENCSRAKQAKASFESGMRMGRTNEKGEREVLDDTMRADEIKRIQTIIEADCN